MCAGYGKKSGNHYTAQQNMGGKILDRGLFRKDGFYNLYGMLPGIFDKPDMSVHASANHAREINIFLVTLHRVFIVAGITFNILR